MSYVSLYRKYRSQTFGDLIGQDHVVRTIQNGIASGRIAHAYLFTGPRGTGKTSTARLLAKALCCENGPTPEPDNTCHICQSITSGSCVDVIEMDAASESGVDDIREQIVEVTEYRPMVCRYKIFIIDEVHDLSPKAFDALLKTIEEPPPHIVFILATTEYNKVPPTIRSRCQKYEFHRGSLQDLVTRLTYVAEHEGITAEPAAVTAIARMADGGYRDALTLLEQAILTSEDSHISLQQVYDQLGLVSEEVVDQLLMAIHTNDVPGIMEVLAEIARLGRDPRSIVESTMYRLADLTRASYQVQTGALDAAREAALHETASRLGRDFILRMRGDLAEAHKSLRDISLPRLWLESEMVRLAGAANAPAPTPRVAVSNPQPAPSRPQPAREVTPAERPQPQPEPEAAEPEPQPTQRAAAPADDWKEIVGKLTVVSRTLGLKLANTRLVDRQDNRVTVEFERQTDLEWLEDKPKAKAAVVTEICMSLNATVDVVFRAGTREKTDDGPTTVELPLEGEKLEQLVREVFGV